MGRTPKKTKVYIKRISKWFGNLPNPMGSTPKKTKPPNHIQTISHSKPRRFFQDFGIISDIFFLDSGSVSGCIGNMSLVVAVVV
jgi:hypothetical protein